MADPNSPTRGQWTTEIFGCYEDPSNCWVTFVCPCLTFARNAEIVDEGKTTAFTAGRHYLVLCNFAPILGATLYACTYRSKLRRRFELPEQPCRHCGDCYVHHLCRFFALCQEHRELSNRHMDPRGGKIVCDFKIFLTTRLHFRP
ncbi:protein plant cadmium resistance 7 [Quercus suber]|uniref:Protein plant cadmium resistance 7 n=1 Tax=Quercus suber TaxID=58331 RepID=A0AAW0KA48_QUESU